MWIFRDTEVQPVCDKTMVYITSVPVNPGLHVCSIEGYISFFFFCFHRSLIYIPLVILV